MSAAGTTSCGFSGSGTSRSMSAEIAIPPKKQPTAAQPPGCSPIERAIISVAVGSSSTSET